MSSTSRSRKPIRDVAPDVPEMLAQIIDEMISPDAASRPRKAGQVAKALRVFLAADEETREPKAEENLAIPRERAAPDPHEEAPEVDVKEDEDDDARPTPSRPARPGTPVPDGAWGKILAAWEDVRPETRDLLFLAGGALGILLLILFAQLLFGLSFVVYIAGLATGAAASYFVELFVRWRRGKDNAPEAQ